jgi:hypothetical protein
MKERLLCIYCNDPVQPERWGLGYHYCMKRICIETGGVSRRENYRLMLMPKQGFTIVHKDSPDLKNGKSSGRS